MGKVTACVIVSTVLLTGCATSETPPLFFGEATTFGVQIGAGPASEGIDFTLGYKDQDLAIVPVSDNNRMIEGWDSYTDQRARKDALSVFGHFGARGSANRTVGNVSLGRFFATGRAATQLAKGFATGMGETSGSSGSTASTNASGVTTNSNINQHKTPGSAQPVAATTLISGRGTDAILGSQGGNTSPATPAVLNGKPEPALIFGQTNRLGIGLSTSLADQGGHFTLGYTGRDIAVVPVMTRVPGGSAIRLGSRDETPISSSVCAALPATVSTPPQCWAESDAFSVLGQFSADSQTAAIKYGLDRFFSTGLAARNLAGGFAAAVDRDLKARRNAATPQTQ